jgi:putative hydrolase of the HAD superfamily
MPADVQVVLADLDDTLFDHAHATRQALARLREIEPRWAEWPVGDFESRHSEILELLHQEVLTGRLTVDAARVERFRRLLGAAALEERAAATRAIEIAREYREAYADSWQPVPGALELLAALVAEGKRIVVVTNNLLAEQRLKVQRCGLERYLTALVTSEEIGAAKPAPEIFEAALRAGRADAASAVMLGDAWLTDIVGARAAAIRAVWLNRLGVPTPDAAVPELGSLLPTRQAVDLLLG